MHGLVYPLFIVKLLKQADILARQAKHYLCYQVSFEIRADFFTSLESI